MKPLKIAIDFDDTFTADEQFWSGVIRLGKLAGHEFYLVTARRRTSENTVLVNQFLDRNKCQMQVFFTNLQSKIDFMDGLGISIDIWIDDDPERLVRGH